MIVIIEGISLTNDYVFKKIFTMDTDVLRDFISSILDENIVSLEFKNSELLPDFLGDKASRLDILAQTDKKEKVNIEMQLEYDKGFDDRMTFYGMRLHTEQLKKGYEYTDINRTILIDILNFTHIKLKGSNEFHTSFKLMNKNGVVLTDKFVIHFVELPKLTDGALDTMTKLDKWLAFLKNEGGKEMIAVLEKEPMIAKAMTYAQAIASDEKERLLAQMRDDAIRNWKWSIASSKEEGEEKGFQDGEKKGFNDGALSAKHENARNFLALGLSIEKVAQGTGLSVEEIKNL